MKKMTLTFAFAAALTFLFSCSRSITTYEAANGKARCGRSIR
ncbi:MAG: hypothetical protein V4725_05130 [Bacteroidota bacterium]|nr:hypothetical protein [Ferruginibacter sp.]